MSAKFLPIGARLGNGRYAITAYLHDGPLMVTYLAEDTSPGGCAVVVHEFFPAELATRNASTRSLESGDDAFDSLAARFESEYRRAMNLDHPAIARTHDVFRENRTVYAVVDFVEGQLLEKIIATYEPRVPERLVRNIIPKLADGLEQMHAEGMVHGHLDPHHVIITRGMLEPVIINPVDLSAPDAAFTAPEGNGTEDSDAYSLGAIVEAMIGNDAKQPGDDEEAVKWAALVARSKREPIARPRPAEFTGRKPVSPRIEPSAISPAADEPTEILPSPEPVPEKKPEAPAPPPLPQSVPPIPMIQPTPKGDDDTTRIGPPSNVHIPRPPAQPPATRPSLRIEEPTGRLESIVDRPVGESMPVILGMIGLLAPILVALAIMLLAGKGSADTIMMVGAGLAFVPALILFMVMMSAEGSERKRSAEYLPTCIVGFITVLVAMMMNGPINAILSPVCLGLGCFWMNRTLKAGQFSDGAPLWVTFLLMAALFFAINACRLRFSRFAVDDSVFTGASLSVIMTGIAFAILGFRKK